ncbi:glycosyltransferase family 4 protein [Leptolyngbya sp. NK1-12]|uniref:Glycosyltransferase family 4 protein n=1 Tax=Leptolyngbya sp. NK1-12 TaxID=2547451 RepID=A0AA97AJ17_9CYAN|nr:glycosyltransferase family 4 protein [Leptolyngbya sp. NK1-12]WNZ27300.1 glycosyltransferase family 4 protein [Leptolyngbya sp. NK1-12]
MKIAFISYEYPPDTALGGIATYVEQAAQMLSHRGHHVEVFAGSSSRTGINIENSIIVHRIIGSNNSIFGEQIGQVFAERHRSVQFDVLEGPEIAANAKWAVQLVPSIPLVIKLHTPTFLIGKYSFVKPTLSQKLRWHLGALRQGKFPKPFPRWQYDPADDIERLHTLEADEIVAPSKAIADALINEWQLDYHKVSHIPFAYIPPAELLNTPINTRTDVITFIGRLEVRKGILDLANAIPLILKYHPNIKFRFVGPAWNSPRRDMNMRQYLEDKLRRHLNSLEFTGSISLLQIPELLSRTDICVFPSIWESYGLVCVEAMAAGRGIVASRAGGMAELLDGGKFGRLISPHSPTEIAEAVIELLNDPELRMGLGQAARERVLSEYNLDRIGALQEASYQRAIERRQRLGPRSATATTHPISNA